MADLHVSMLSAIRLHDRLETFHLHRWLGGINPAVVHPVRAFKCRCGTVIRAGSHEKPYSLPCTGMNKHQTAQTLTVPQAARLLGIGRNLAYEAIKRGEIPNISIGHRILVPRAGLERLLSEGSIYRKPSGPEERKKT